MVLAAIWVLGGVVEGLAPPMSATYSLVFLGESVATALLALLWVRYDAAERDLQVSGRMSLAICLVAVLGVPYYLLRSRGWRGFLSIGAAAAYLFGVALLSGLVATMMGNLYFLYVRR